MRATFGSIPRQPAVAGVPRLAPALLAAALSVLLGAAAPADARTALPPAKPARVLATQALGELPVKGRAPKTGYSRSQFGRAWADEDHNGCDTRNDILKRDLVQRTVKPKTQGCVVLTGTLIDPYSGQEIAFERGQDSAEVQIDHVVALSNAWQTGAFLLSVAQRQQLANDPLNLLAVQGRLNSQKGDGDTATWLPPRKAYRCAYVARQAAVKRRYHLWVTPAERDAIARVLANCPGEPLPN